jgi:hypothetical protein
MHRVFRLRRNIRRTLHQTGIASNDAGTPTADSFNAITPRFGDLLRLTMVVLKPASAFPFH